MDTIVKITIGLFVFAIFLLFFKVTKNLSEGYMDAHITSYTDVDEIMNRDTNYYDTTELDDFNSPIQYLDSNIDPNEIVWKING